MGNTFRSISSELIMIKFCSSERNVMYSLFCGALNIPMSMVGKDGLSFNWDGFISHWDIRAVLFLLTEDDDSEWACELLLLFRFFFFFLAFLDDFLLGFLSIDSVEGVSPSQYAVWTERFFKFFAAVGWFTAYADGDVSEGDDGACPPPPLDGEEYALQTDDGNVAGGGDVEALFSRVAISASADRGQPDMMWWWWGRR